MMPYQHVRGGPFKQRMQLLIGVDSIFLYQFAVYAVIFGWGIYRIFWHAPPPAYVSHAMPPQVYHVMDLSFLIAPVVVFAGYFIKNQAAGIRLCLFGDLSLTFAVAAYNTAFYGLGRIGLPYLIMAAIGLCLAVRSARDLAAIILIRRKPKFTARQLETATNLIETKRVEKVLELAASQELSGISEAVDVLKETRSKLQSLAETDANIRSAGTMWKMNEIQKLIDLKKTDILLKEAKAKLDIPQLGEDTSNE